MFLNSIFLLISVYLQNSASQQKTAYENKMCKITFNCETCSYNNKKGLILGAHRYFRFHSILIETPEYLMIITNILNAVRCFFQKIFPLETQPLF